MDWAVYLLTSVTSCLVSFPFYWKSIAVFKARSSILLKPLTNFPFWTLNILLAPLIYHWSPAPAFIMGSYVLVLTFQPNCKLIESRNPDVGYCVGWSDQNMHMLVGNFVVMSTRPFNSQRFSKANDSVSCVAGVGCIGKYWFAGEEK